jgi:hypothetical protein
MESLDLALICVGGSRFAVDRHLHASLFLK